MTSFLRKNAPPASSPIPPLPIFSCPFLLIFNKLPRSVFPPLPGNNERSLGGEGRVGYYADDV